MDYTDYIDYRNKRYNKNILNNKIYNKKVYHKEVCIIYNEKKCIGYTNTWQEAEYICNLKGNLQWTSVENTDSNKYNLKQISLIDIKI